MSVLMALHYNFDTIEVRVHFGANGCIRVQLEWSGGHRSGDNSAVDQKIRIIQTVGRAIIDSRVQVNLRAGRVLQAIVYIMPNHLYNTDS